MERRGVFLTPWERRFIEILWILSFGAGNSCPDQNGVTMNCSILPMEGLNCTYVKGAFTDPPIDSYVVPGAVKSLNVGTGYAPANDECETRVNITWKVEASGALNYLKGFFLNVSFVYNKTSYSIYRTFNVSATNWNSATQTTARHGGLSVTRLINDQTVAGSTPCNDPGQVVCAHRASATKQ